MTQNLLEKKKMKRINNQVSLVEEEGFGSPFFYLILEALDLDRRTLKRKTRKLAYVLSNFFKVAEMSQCCNYVTVKCYYCMSEMQ